MVIQQYLDQPQSTVSNVFKFTINDNTIKNSHYLIKKIKIYRIRMNTYLYVQ